MLNRNHHIIVIELTCCFESNLVHSRNFKIKKNIKILKDKVKLQSTKLKHFFLEVSSLGFIAKTSKPLEKFLLKSNINCDRLKQKMSETAIRGSHYIYTRRNKEWNNPQIMKFL